MDNLKTIQVIHASDADQHLGHLKRILEELKNEKRIENYVTLDSESLNENSFKELAKEDMVITLLTNGIESGKKDIEEKLLSLKAHQPGAKFAEIIIDNIPYEPQFIAFPSDLQPIRSREDMDAVWNTIGESLRDIFPAYKEPTPKPVLWKKYIPFVLGALGIVAVFFLVRVFTSTEKPIPKEEVPIEEPNVNIAASVVVNGSSNINTNCPYKLNFAGKIKADGPAQVQYTWLRSDGATAPVKTLDFSQAGTKDVTTSWNLGGSGKNYTNYWQQLKIIDPIVKVSNKATFNLKCKEELNEDCLSFNYNNVRVQQTGTKWRVTDGVSSMMIFRTRAKAQLAVNIIKRYRMNAQCFATRPNPGLKYFKVGNRLPSGSYTGEDCIKINNPSNLRIRKNNNTSYSILDGNHIPFSAKSLAEAQKIVELVKHYKPNYTCYVERPNPGMSYLKM